MRPPASCTARGMARWRSRSSAVENCGAVRAEVARVVGREAAGDDERRAAARALGVERGEALHAVGPRLEPGVHRAHQDAVGQRDEAEVERLEAGAGYIAAILRGHQQRPSTKKSANQRGAGEHGQRKRLAEEQRAPEQRRTPARGTSRSARRSAPMSVDQAEIEEVGDRAADDAQSEEAGRRRARAGTACGGAERRGAAGAAGRRRAACRPPCRARERRAPSACMYAPAKP